MIANLATNYGPLGLVISIGIIGLVCFILLRFIKGLFSLSFLGFIGSLISYFVYDFVFATVPVVAAISFVMCLCGFSNGGIIRKVFSVMGILISAYIILRNYGILPF